MEKLWQITPIFTPLTLEMIDRREAPTFRHWEITDNTTDEVLLATTDPEALKARLLELSGGSLYEEVFAMALPVIPETEDDWDGVREMLCFLEQHSDTRPTVLPIPHYCSMVISLERVTNMLTEQIHEEIPPYDDPKDLDEEAFDAHCYTPLREALSELLQ